MKRAIKILLAAVVTVAMFAVVTIFASADTYVDRDWAADYYYSDEVRSYTPYDDDIKFEARVVYIERYTDEFYFYEDLLLLDIEGSPSICGSFEGYYYADSESFWFDEETSVSYSFSDDSFTCWYDSSFAITFVIVDDVSQYRSASDYVLISREFDMDVLITNEYVTADHSSHTGYYCDSQESYRKIYLEAGFSYFYWTDIYFSDLYPASSIYACFWSAPYDCGESTDDSGLSPDEPLEYYPEWFQDFGGHHTIGFADENSFQDYYYLDVYVVEDPSAYIKASDDSGDSGGDDGGDEEVEIPGEIPGLDGPPMGSWEMFLGEEGSYIWYGGFKSPVIYSDLNDLSYSVPVITVDSNTGFVNECLPHLFDRHLSDVYGHSSKDCTPLKVYVSTFYELGTLQTKHYDYAELVDPFNIYSVLFGAHGYYLVTIVAENSNCSAGCRCSGYSYFSFYVVSQMGSSSYSFSVTDSVESFYQSGYDAGYADGLKASGSGSSDGDLDSSYWHDGFSAGFSDGERYGYDLGYQDGLAIGALEYDRGYEAGYDNCLVSNNKKWYQEGYNSGYDVGFKQGSFESGVSSDTDYMEGYTNGYADGIGVTMEQGGNPISGFFAGIGDAFINGFSYAVTNIYVSSSDGGYRVTLLQMIETVLFVIVAAWVIKFLISKIFGVFS